MSVARISLRKASYFQITVFALLGQKSSTRTADEMYRSGTGSWFCLLTFISLTRAFISGPLNVMQAAKLRRCCWQSCIPQFVHRNPFSVPRWQILFYFITSIELLQPLIFLETPINDAFSRKTWRKSSLRLILTYMHTHPHTHTHTRTACILSTICKR